MIDSDRLKEGKFKKSGVNPAPKTPKPIFTPPAQKTQTYKGNKMTQTYKDILSENIFKMVSDFINFDTDCSIIVQNHNNWNIELPKRLKMQEQFILNVDKQTMENSYIDEDRKIVINTVFDNVEYSKVFESADIAGIVYKGNPIMVKPFIETPKIPTPKKTLNNGVTDEVDEDGVRKSMEMFKKHNPELF